MIFFCIFAVMKIIVSDEYTSVLHYSRYLFIHSPAFYPLSWSLFSELSNELSLAFQSYLLRSLDEMENGAFNVMSVGSCHTAARNREKYPASREVSTPSILQIVSTPSIIQICRLYAIAVAWRLSQSQCSISCAFPQLSERRDEAVSNLYY